MQAKGFFGSLFDYSFSSYITPRIIKVLYVLATVLVALWTLVIILIAFKASSGLGIVALLIGGPIYFVIMMIGARVVLEFISAFFRIHGDVQEINVRGGGNSVASAPPLTPTAAYPSSQGASVAVSSPAPESAAESSEAGRFCESCGAERGPGKAFCRACGEPFD
ncbi:MAG: DUF4282 domain-containing protein [Gaiellaceae bacterium]